jgi:putative colanic acid biosynthesis acetyltransferase WcaF
MSNLIIESYQTKIGQKKTDLSLYNNQWYKPGKNLFIRFLWYFINCIFFLNPLNPSSRLKILLLRIFGAKVGKGVVIKPSVNIKYPWRLKIGNHVWIGEKVWIDNLADVEIDDHVCISQGAMILTGSHDYTKVTFDLKVEKIVIKTGVWIGAKSIINKGVTCETHSILSALSTTTKNLDAYSIYMGNPAIKIKERFISD